MPRVQEEQVLEVIGDLLAKVGLPLESGRLLGYMLICDPPCQTIEELAGALGMDRERTLRMGEMLVQFGMCEKLELPDKQCFALRPVDQLMSQRMSWLGDFRRALDQAAEGVEHRYERLEDFRSLYDILDDELPRIIECWRARKA